MKQLFILLLFINFCCYAQDFSKVDEIVTSYPRFSKVENLAAKIKQDFSSETNKARAAFFWLANNIRYNLKEFYNPKQRHYSFRYSTEEEKERKLQAIKDKLISDTFRNKTGVCEEYAQSFKKICDLLEIEAEVIKGYVRNDVNEIGKIPNTTNHAWNAVKINGKWVILDATWAAGYEYNARWIQKFNDYYFNIPKNKIFKTHYPEDKLWVLRFGRVEINDFFNQPIFSDDFLKSKAELIFPINGIITINKSKSIILKFKNLDTTQLIFYTLKGLKMAQKPEFKTENNVTTLFLKNPMRNSELVLYMNNNDAILFKIKVY